MKGITAALLALLMVGVPNVGSAEETDSTLRLYWKDGLRMETSDKQFKLKLGGRMMADWAWFDVDDEIDAVTGKNEDGAEFRRARLYVAGEIYENVIFKAEYDFAGGEAQFKDVYIGLKDLGPLGTFRAGHMYEPVGLEEQTSSKYITFMERSLTSVFIPSRNTGFQFNNTCADQKVTWSIGAFHDTDDFGDSEGDNWNVSTRVTGTPLVTDDALVHLGFSYRYGVPNDTQLRLRQRPSAHMAMRWVAPSKRCSSRSSSGRADRSATVGRASRGLRSTTRSTRSITS